MQIYLARNNEQAGPYTLEQVNHMLAAGQVVLTDLAWHEGMDNWQPVSQLTGGQLHYSPNQGSPFNSAPPMSNPDQHAPEAARVDLSKPIQGQVASAPLASLGKRILGAVLDNVLTIVALSPVITHINMDALAEKSGSFEGMQALMNNVPEMNLIMAMLLLLGIAIAQTALIIKRGQSIGKLILGTRIVDQESGIRPNAMNTFVLRSFVIGLLYNLPLVGVVVMIADLAMLLFSPERISLHDRLAKTLVVEARPEQLPK